MAETQITDVYVCNVALSLFGGEAVENISAPQTDVESHCARIYPVVRNSLLSRYDWKFCRSVRQLVVNADVVALGGFKHAFKLPADMVAGPFAVYADGNIQDPVLQYMNANGHIHTNYDRVDVLIKTIPPEKDWPAYFLDLVATAVGARLAKPVAEDEGFGEKLHVDAFGPDRMDQNGGMFGIAKRLDAQTAPLKKMFTGGNPLSVTRY